MGISNSRLGVENSQHRSEDEGFRNKNLKPIGHLRIHIEAILGFKHAQTLSKDT